jgi:hypothetical protein
VLQAAWHLPTLWLISLLIRIIPKMISRALVLHLEAVLMIQEGCSSSLYPVSILANRKEEKGKHEASFFLFKGKT